MATKTKAKRSSSESSGPGPSELMAAKLETSCLDARYAARLGMRLLSPDETEALGPSFKRGDSFVIPYHDEDGRQTPFFRVRYLRLEGFAAGTKKPPRYMQPDNMVPGVYMPPVRFSGLGWRDVMSDADVSLVVTEGELKAACACRLGFPTLGLGGVDAWQSKKRGLPFLPELERFAWEGRRAYVVFDSDSQSNPSVMRALSRLSAELVRRGADVHVTRVPPSDDGGKQGLDDFVYAGGDLAWLLSDCSERHAAAGALARLNEEVAYVVESDCVAELATGRLMLRDVFVNGAYANRTHVEQVASEGGGTRMVRRSTPKEWLAWEHRAELRSVVYRPGEGRTPDGCFNTWPGWGCEPAVGDVGPWTDLLDYLFDGAADGAREWFEKWCAYPVARPGTKMYSACLFWGETHGTGKSLVGYTLAAVYGRNAAIIGQADLHGAFNAWAHNRQFVMGEEISGTDKRADNDRLKGLISQQQITINVKYAPQHTVDDVINYYFTSNHPDSFFLERTDRRLFVREVPQAPLPFRFYAAYDDWLKSGEGAPALFAHLLGTDLRGFEPRAPALWTPEKGAMIDMGRTDAAQLVDELLGDPAGHLSRWSVSADVLRPTQLQHLLNADLVRPVSLKALGVLMRSRLRTASRPVHSRYYVLRNQERWMSCPERELYDHWAAHFAGGAASKF